MSSTTVRPATWLLACGISHLLNGIVWREALRFLHQRERFISALGAAIGVAVHFAAGFRQVLGISHHPAIRDLHLYEVISRPTDGDDPALQRHAILALDGLRREMGNMRTLLVSPLPRGYLLFCKLLAGTAVSLLRSTPFC